MMKKPTPGKSSASVEEPFFISPPTQLAAAPERADQREDEPCERAPILNRSDPMVMAKEFVRRHYFEESFPTLYYHGRSFWRWNGSFYEALEEAVLSAEVYGFLDKAKTYSNRTIGLVRFVLKPEDASNIIQCVKAITTLSAQVRQPYWLHRNESAPNLIAFKNCLVDVQTGEAIASTPRLWITDAVDFEFDPSAQCARWVQFLQEIHPDDPAAQACIEEHLGYGMTYDMRFEKGALWIGEKHSGKTTILEIQRKLVGDRAYSALSFHDWVRGENSRANLVGKKVIAFPDVRLKPAKDIRHNRLRSWRP
jgi:putative DNA primase/helicase